MFDAASNLEVPAEKRNLGLVFQSYALWPHKTVFDNVAYGLKLRKVAAAEIRQRVDSALGTSASATSATASRTSSPAASSSASPSPARWSTTRPSS